jgi:hypothetical protein
MKRYAVVFEVSAQTDVRSSEMEEFNENIISPIQG